MTVLSSLNENYSSYPFILRKNYSNDLFLNIHLSISVLAIQLNQFDRSGQVS